MSRRWFIPIPWWRKPEPPRIVVNTFRVRRSDIEKIKAAKTDQIRREVAMMRGK